MEQTRQSRPASHNGFPGGARSNSSPPSRYHMNRRGSFPIQQQFQGFQGMQGMPVFTPNRPQAGGGFKPTWSWWEEDWSEAYETLKRFLKSKRSILDTDFVRLGYMYYGYDSRSGRTLVSLPEKIKEIGMEKYHMQDRVRQLNEYNGSDEDFKKLRDDLKTFCRKLQPLSMILKNYKNNKALKEKFDDALTLSAMAYFIYNICFSEIQQLNRTHKVKTLELTDENVKRLAYTMEGLFISICTPALKKKKYIYSALVAPAPAASAPAAPTKATEATKTPAAPAVPALAASVLAAPTTGPAQTKTASGLMAAHQGGTRTGLNPGNVSNV